MTPFPTPFATELFLARLKYWAWFALTKIVLGLICSSIVSEGLRMFVPASGQKVHRIAGLAFLRSYEETHNLDIAMILSLVFVFCVFLLISKLLKLWMPSDLIDRADLLWGSDREKIIVTVIGAVLLSIDLLLWYTAISRMRWGSSIFSLAGMIVTVAYLCVLIFVSYVSLKQLAQIKELKELSSANLDDRILEPFAQGEAA